jgi:hypothetical protein
VGKAKFAGDPTGRLDLASMPLTVVKGHGTGRSVVLPRPE